MADLELVIKLSEDSYKATCRGSMLPPDVENVVNAIKNGTPLPKGHGELKDADVMINKLCTNEASESFGSTTCAEISDFIDSEKPIIEADKQDYENDYYKGAQEEY